MDDQNSGANSHEMNIKFSELRDALIGPNRRRDNLLVPNGFFGAQPLRFVDYHF